MTAALLVVDDNEQNRDMLSRRLARRGYEVATAEDGPRALAAVRDRAFDLVLLDIEMPGMSGLEVLKALRETKTRADLPVIMATARDTGEDIVRALNLGANDYVTKPLDFPVVIARVESQLSLKRAMEEIRRLATQLEIRNDFIRRTFGRYLSDEVVKSLLETPEGLALGGEKREVTVLFADLRGFTALSDRHTPEQVVALLNNYLGAMADVITAYQGTIDEFIGDAILALFGAPVARPDDPERAAACAVAMQRAMAGVNDFNRGHGLPEVHMGIAVNTGDVVVGNIGSQTRAKYGVVGTHVNLAGRIEGFTVGGQILVSESTLRRAGGSLVVGDKVTFEAKGFADPVAVYDLRGVGGAHQLHLPARDEARVALRPPLPVSVTVLEGKQVGAAAFEATIVAASRESAELQAPGPVAAFANLRLRLGAGAAAEVYAKVTGGGEAGRVLLRFTSVGPEAARALEAALASA
jgi:class 3 adenylate cyclase